MKRLLVLLCLIITMGKAYAKPLVVQEPADGINLSESLSYWEDQTAQVDFPAIQNLSSEQFTASVGASLNFGFSTSAYWAQFALINPGTETIQLILEYRYPNVDYLDFYYPDGQGSFQKKLRGDQRPAAHREIPGRMPAFYLTLPPGESTFYVRIQTQGASQLPIYLWSPESFHNKRVNESSFLALLYGFLIVMVMYNSFLAITIRSGAHVIYVLFILNSLLHFMGMQGFYFLFVPEPIAAWMNNVGFMLTAGLTVTLATVFSRSFLDLRVYSKNLYRLLSWVACLGLAVMLITLFSYTLGSRLAAISGVITPLAVLTASVYCCFKHFRPAYFFTLAWIACILGYVLYALLLSGLLPVNALSSWGPFLGVSFEVVLISLALGDKMHLQQQLAERQIRDLNENLELKVVEKTRDIHSIMSHIKLGILSIRGQDLLIDREYSASMETMFHEKDLAGKKALDILFRDADLPRDVISIMESALVASIGEHAIAMELNGNCLVRELRLNQNGQSRIIELDWNPIFGKDQLTEKILVTVRDVTEIHDYQQAMAVQRKELEYISELIALSQDHASKFFASARHFIDKNRRLILQDSHSHETVNQLLASMHTLKGSARSLGLKDLSALSHDVEQILSQLQGDLGRWDAKELLQGQAKVEKLVDAYEDLLENKLNRHKINRTSVPIAVSDIFAVIHDIEVLQQQTSLPAIRMSLENLRGLAIERISEKASDLMQELTKPLDELARDLGKAAPRISLDLDEILFTKEAADTLRYSILHILRNSLDHGLETPQERLHLGKPEQGEVSLSVKDRGDCVEIRVSDDGRGLALKSIETIAQQRGLIPSRHKLTALEIGSLIFESGFSTLQQVSEISGRGVGMDAVKRQLEALHGSVHLEFESSLSGPLPDRAPFHLLLRIPQQYFHRAHLNRSA